MSKTLKETKPKKIFLQIGEVVTNDIDFNDLYTKGVSWCAGKINENDLEYWSKEEALSYAKAKLEEVHCNNTTNPHITNNLTNKEEILKSIENEGN